MLAGEAPLAHRQTGRLGTARRSALACDASASGYAGRSPEGMAMLAGDAPLAHRQTGRLGAARRSALACDASASGYAGRPQGTAMLAGGAG